jgi:hypothetical protein
MSVNIAVAPSPEVIPSIRIDLAVDDVERFVSGMEMSRRFGALGRRPLSCRFGDGSRGW